MKYIYFMLTHHYYIYVFVPYVCVCVCARKFHQSVVRPAAWRQTLSNAGQQLLRLLNYSFPLEAALQSISSLHFGCLPVLCYAALQTFVHFIGAHHYVWHTDARFAAAVSEVFYIKNGNAWKEIERICCEYPQGQTGLNTRGLKRKKLYGVMYKDMNKTSINYFYCILNCWKIYLYISVYCLYCICDKCTYVTVSRVPQSTAKV